MYPDTKDGCETHHQIETEFIQKSGFACHVQGVFNLKTTRSENYAERDPETAIRGERGSTKGVANGHFPRSESCQLRSCLSVMREDGYLGEDIPHASKQLHQSTVPKRNAYDQIRRAQSSRPHVDQTQYECRQGESRQAQWSGIGDLAVLHLAIQTRLEFTSESWETLLAAAGVDVCERTITEASGGFGGLVFFMGHFASHATVGFLVVVARRVAGMLSVGVGRHGEGEEVLKGLGSFEVGEAGCGGSGNVLYSKWEECLDYEKQCKRCEINLIYLVRARSDGEAGGRQALNR